MANTQSMYICMCMCMCMCMCICICVYMCPRINSKFGERPYSGHAWKVSTLAPFGGSLRSYHPPQAASTCVAPLRIRLTLCHHSLIAPKDRTNPWWSYVQLGLTREQCLWGEMAKGMPKGLLWNGPKVAPNSTSFFTYLPMPVEYFGTSVIFNSHPVMNNPLKADWEPIFQQIKVQGLSVGSG